MYALAQRGFNTGPISQRLGICYNNHGQRFGGMSDLEGHW